MKTLNLVQGSPEWLAHRSNQKTRNASDAPAMMGASKHLSRSDLLKRIATGHYEEVSPHMQALFDRGHAAEASIRPHVEKVIGDDLYPATGVSDEYPWMSASFDGITMDETVIFEHKLLNAELFRAVTNGEELDPHFYWQLEQQLTVSGAEKAVFVVSDGTPENEAHCWYTPVPGRRDALLAGWAQFEKDLATYVHEEQAPVAVATPVMDLPAVNVNIEGALQVLSNLPEFGARLRTFIDGLNPAPESDQDFADAENEVKVLKRAEDELEAAESRALSQIAVVDEMRKMKAMLHKLARDTRLAREKLVKDRKEFVRSKIQSDAVALIEAHCRDAEKFLGGNYLPPIPHDIAGAMKGKKTMASLKDAAATAVAKWKIEADGITKIINANLALLDENHEHAFLFNDKKTLVLKDPEAVAAIVAQRIAEHDAAEAKKAEALAEAAREKIRREEQERAQAEVRAREQAEAARRAAERQEAEAAELAEAARRASEAMAATLSEVTPPAAVEVAPQAPPAVVPSIVDDQVREITQAAKPAGLYTAPPAEQIVDAVAQRFGVPKHIAAGWLLTMNVAELAKVAA